MKESAELLKSTQRKIFEVVEKLAAKGTKDMLSARKDIQIRLKDFLYEQTHRRPVIIVAVVEI
jgi:mRNA degradation ribonuclease J1/J2